MANKNSKIRTRFAPSPTGFVHIGSLRTALFAFLFARHNKGDFSLRIEDTDQNRFVEGSLENMLKVFKTVGIEFDEGPYIQNGQIEQKGDFRPYIQSERKAQGIYQKYAEQLLSDKKAYYCFCSEQRLEDLRKEQAALKKPSMYDRRCRNLTNIEVKKQLDEFKSKNMTPVIRFAIPLDGQTVIHDLIYGDIKYENSLLDDQVIIKSDGFPTYHLAVVVDDHLMEITHVIRGEEWIPSTPKHLLIYQALAWQPTQFAHLPLIVNPDKTKLSKRQGDVAAEDYLKAGYLPEALLNFIALLGWNPKTEQEIFSLEELIAQFDLTKVHTSNAVLDKNKLDWISSQYIRQMPINKLVDLLVPYWMEDKIIELRDGKLVKLTNGKTVPESFLASITELEKDRLKKLSEIGDRTKYFFAEPQYDAGLLVWKKSDIEKTRQALTGLAQLLNHTNDFSRENLEIQIKKFITDNNFDNGSVLWPLRVALTGLDKSSGPFEVAATLALGLGKEEIIKRLRLAVEKLR